MRDALILLMEKVLNDECVQRLACQSLIHSKFIQSRTGLVYFVIRYVFFVHLCFIS